MYCPHHLHRPCIIFQQLQPFDDARYFQNKEKRHRLLTLGLCHHSRYMRGVKTPQVFSIKLQQVGHADGRTPCLAVMMCSSLGIQRETWNIVRSYNFIIISHEQFPTTLAALMTHTVFLRSSFAYSSANHHHRHHRHHQQHRRSATKTNAIMQVQQQHSSPVAPTCSYFPHSTHQKSECCQNGDSGLAVV